MTLSRYGAHWDNWTHHLALPMVLFREGGMKIKNVPRSVKVEALAGNNGALPPSLLSGGSTRDSIISGRNCDQKIPNLIKSEFVAKLTGSNSSINNSGSKSPGPGFDCSACGRIYKLKSSLRNHQKWECGKEPQFSCPYCVYKAKQKMHIARHLERMHKCEVTSDAIVKTQQQAQLEQQKAQNMTI